MVDYWLKEAKEAKAQLEEWDKELNGLHEKNRDLNLQVQILESEKKQLQSELAEVRSQLSSQTAPQLSEIVELPDTIDYSILKIRDLKKLAKAAKIKYYGNMNTAELVDELKKIDSKKTD